MTVPCIAQELEPEGLFGIHGTVWRKIGVWQSHFGYSEELFGIDRGFYDCRVYGLDRDQWFWHKNDYYYDFLAGSFYKFRGVSGIYGGPYDEYIIVEKGILFLLIGIRICQSIKVLRIL